MHAEAPDMSLVAVARRMPLITRRKVLKALKLIPGVSVVGRHVEMRWVGPRIKALAIRTGDDRVHFFTWDTEILPRLSLV
jgi:hypothetical protein